MEVMEVKVMNEQEAWSLFYFTRSFGDLSELAYRCKGSKRKKVLRVTTYFADIAAAAFSVNAFLFAENFDFECFRKSHSVLEETCKSLEKIEREGFTIPHLKDRLTDLHRYSFVRFHDFLVESGCQIPPYRTLFECGPLCEEVVQHARRFHPKFTCFELKKMLLGDSSVALSDVERFELLFGADPWRKAEPFSLSELADYAAQVSQTLIRWVYGL